jgi:hypothetical protein
LIDQFLLISFIYSIDQKKVLHESYLGVVVVQEDGWHRWQQWCRRRLASTVKVVTSGVESGGYLESFGMKSETTRG